MNIVRKLQNEPNLTVLIIIDKLYREDTIEMNKSNKFAWTWKIKPECIEEYVQMHQNPWREILDEHSKANIKNYSIFQNGNQFFYCFECDDAEAAFKYLNQSEICKKWNSITSTMVEGSFDLGDSNTIIPLNEVFYLK
jgi:L-rhamnose mutarotase